MFEQEIPSKVGWFIGIGLLVSIIFNIFLSYQLGLYHGDVRTATIITEYTKGQNVKLKEAIEFYQSFLQSGYQFPEDTTIQVKKGTIVIPPATEQPDI